MSPLSVLYLILPFPAIFVLHEVEEIATHKKWISNHKTELETRFPKLKRIIDQLSQLSTKGFAVASFEELLIILLATAYVLIDGTSSLEIWSAIFMAFSLHLLVHIVQAIAVRGYIPGLISSVLTLPFVFLVMNNIWNEFSIMQIMAYAILGFIVMLVNLNFAHLIGRKFK